ncbi:MAG: sialate O-acetylesterase [Melioribacteraceae bacterium]|nr:sialate O-acetylesterase [Melioribacteraceae bacterium]
MKNKKVFLVNTFFFLLIYYTLFAEVKLPKLISNGMILQRDTKVKLWGWANPNEKIKINFINKNYSTIADKDGNWFLILPKLKSGGPYEMKINGENEIIIKDILIGDVWLASGQSNMELPIKRVWIKYKDELKNYSNDSIRQFAVPQEYDFKEPRIDLRNGEWKKADKENIQNFSAVAFFFAKELFEKIKVPIGIIHASLGGSPAEAWISEDNLKKFPNHLNEAIKFRDDSLIKEIETNDRNKINSWLNQLSKSDSGFISQVKWYSDEIDLSNWKKIYQPSLYSKNEIKNHSGVIWFRKNFEVDTNNFGKAELFLGRIVDADSTWINGVLVGTTGYTWPPRIYKISEGLLKQNNTLVVRVTSNNNEGGFFPDKPFEIIINDNYKIDLKGDWYYKVSVKSEPSPSQTFIRWKPLGLFNAMISPLLNYKIRGVIWYQGESNVSRYEEYKTLFPALINDWREKFNNKNLPFLFVQLASFLEAKDYPSESWWAMLRESQLKTLSVPNTAMVVTIDIGEWNDIHPLNKKDVGIRLALAALKKSYNKKIVYSGPLYKNYKIVGNKIEISFEHIGKGLTTRNNEELKGFAICDESKNFVWADAVIKNNKVIVWNDSIQKPIAVRYAWADNPYNANLINKEGLPASPFRTDNFNK